MQLLGSQGQAVPKDVKVAGVASFTKQVERVDLREVFVRNIQNVFALTSRIDDIVLPQVFLEVCVRLWRYFLDERAIPDQSLGSLGSGLFRGLFLDKCLLLGRLRFVEALVLFSIDLFEPLGNLLSFIVFTRAFFVRSGLLVVLDLLSLFSLSQGAGVKREANLRVSEGSSNESGTYLL